jgi:predicted Zn finger-like uncharacterized protein
MKITCPDCSTSYQVKDSLIGSGGRSVKCARCGARWQAHAEADTTSIETELPGSADASAAEARVPQMANAGATDDALANDAAGAMMANAAPDDMPDDVDWSDSLREATRPDPEQQAAADEDALAFDVGSDLMSSEDPFAGTPEEVADGDDEGGTPPVDIETLARRPKIHVRERSDEPVYKRLARRAAHHVRQVRPRRVVGAAFFVFALALFGVAILFRTPIVARVPDLAGLYALAGFEVNLRGLEFKDLRTFRELDDGSIVLVIEGTIQNVSDEPAYVPAVRFALRSEDAQEIYAWVVEPRARRLATSDTTRIRTRLASPPDLAADIHVRFVERTHEKQASMK